MGFLDIMNKLLGTAQEIIINEAERKENSPLSKAQRKYEEEYSHLSKNEKINTYKILKEKYENNNTQQLKYLLMFLQKDIKNS